MLTRKAFLKTLCIAGCIVLVGGLMNMLMAANADSPMPASGLIPGKPNIILINTDDLGYGDLGCYGGAVIKTPHIDSLASRGMRFTDFHSCDSVCSPSRAGLLTGRYPRRMGLDIPLQPQNLPMGKRMLLKFGYLMGGLGLIDISTEHGASGLDQKEITLAESLKTIEYATGMVGKWHLGDYSQDEQLNPLHHGFDFYFGVPHSNDMTPFPLYRGFDELEAHIEDQGKLTSQYTRETVKFIKANADKPFFLYFAHTFPHRPLFASDDFRNRSEAGRFGDTVEEIDWSVGDILKTLEKLQLQDNTLVLFTSDNGPWYQGSSGQLRGRKGQSYEGGHRVPFIAFWPGVIKADSTCAVSAMNIDLFPTLLKLAGTPLPGDRIIDGKNMASLLLGQSSQYIHDYLYFYHHGKLEAARTGPWKVYRSANHYVWPMPINDNIQGTWTNYTTGPLPMMFNLDKDQGEAYNVFEKHLDMGNRLLQQMEIWDQHMDSNRKGWL